MMNAAIHVSAAGDAPGASQVHRAFESLDGVDRWLLEEVLFDGRTCVQIARAVGVAPSEIRWRVGAAMLELRAMQIRDGETEHGAVAAMLALRALDALDADEAAVIDAMLEREPAQLQAYAGYCEVVGELCRMVPEAVPPPAIFERLFGGSGDDLAVN